MTASRNANLRTALVFASVAATFFGGIIVAHAIGGPVIGVGVMGAVVLAFLLLAIGRNLRGRGGGASRCAEGASPSGGRSGDSRDRSSSMQGPRP